MVDLILPTWERRAKGETARKKEGGRARAIPRFYPGGGGESARKEGDPFSSSVRRSSSVSSASESERRGGCRPRPRLSLCLFVSINFASIPNACGDTSGKEGRRRKGGPKVSPSTTVYCVRECGVRTERKQKFFHKANEGRQGQGRCLRPSANTVAVEGNFDAEISVVPQPKY